MAFNAEMFDGQMFLPIVGQGFVKFAVFLLRNVIGITGPNGFCLVQFLIFSVLFLKRKKAKLENFLLDAKWHFIWNKVSERVGDDN